MWLGIQPRGRATKPFLSKPVFDPQDQEIIQRHLYQVCFT